MQLNKKKELASKVLGVGKGRIVFMTKSLSEIKEAITRQDIADLHKAGAIQIREVNGRKTVVKRKHRRGVGKIKKRVPKSKQKYVIMTRKLRKVSHGLVKTNKISKDLHREIRKMIKASRFKSRHHLLDFVEKQ